MREIEATQERVAQAVKDAGFGESTLLACRGELSVDQAAAIARRHRQGLWLEEEVRISVGHGRIYVRPSDVPARRRLPKVADGLDRRSVFDRRIGERRQPADGTPPLEGERRSGRDRRSGHDRRRPVRTATLR
jgi:hypothetical protein